MTALLFPSSYSSLSAISPYLFGLTQENSHIDENLLHGEQALQVLFSTLWTTTMKEVALDHT